MKRRGKTSVDLLILKDKEEGSRLPIQSAELSSSRDAKKPRRTNSDSSKDHQVSVKVSKEGQTSSQKVSATCSPRKKATVVRNTKPKARFNEGSTVLAFSRSQLYEAKILKLREQISAFGTVSWQYLVHYNGWPSKWDEWLTDDKVFIICEENIALKAKMKADALAAEAARKSAVRTPSKPSTNEPKIENNSNIDATDEEPKDKSLRINIPSILQRCLLEDLNLIEESKLVPIPRRPNIVDILNQFEEFREQKQSEISNWKEFVQDLTVYFDRALGLMLLYKFERYQYREFRLNNPKVRPSEIYGAEHLLRLIAKLPGLLHAAGLASRQVSDFHQRVMELLRFMEKKCDNLVLLDHSPADTAYIEAADTL